MFLFKTDLRYVLLFYLDNLSEYFGVKFLADFIFGEIEEASGRSHLNVEDGLVSVGGR